MKWLETDPSLNAALGTATDEWTSKIFGGLTIQTTLDPDIASAARQQILAKVPQNNDRGIGSAAVAIDPRTGEVRGMAQNTSYSIKPQNRGETEVNWAVDTKYGGSVGFGSTEKAFALVTALEKGMPISSTVDAKTAGPQLAATYTGADFPDACGLGRQTWSVRNDELVPGGPTTLTHATARSINTAFVALVSQLGACTVRDTETRLGLHQSNGQPVKPYPAAITLGTDSVSPMTVASAYGSLGNNGIHCTPVPVQAITTSGGQTLPVPRPGTTNCQQVVDPDVAHGVAAIMSAVVSGEGTAAASALADGRPAAGKPEPLTATMRRGSSATPRNCPPPSGSGHPSRTPRSWTTSRSVASSTPLSTAPASPRPSGRPSPTESSTASPTFRSPPPATRSPTGTPAQRPYPHPPPDSNHTRDMLRWSVQQPARNDDSNPRRRFGGPYRRKTGAAASDASRSTSTAPKPPTGTRKGTASRAIAANRSPAPSMALARPTRMVRRSSTECIRRLDRPAV